MAKVAKKKMGRPALPASAQFAKMFKAGTPVAEIARETGKSYSWVHQSLSKAGVLHAGQARSVSAEAKSASGGKMSARAEQSGMVEAIAKEVASAILGDATVVPQAKTRSELFASITKGVKAGVIGFRP